MTYSSVLHEFLEPFARDKEWDYCPVLLDFRPAVLLGDETEVTKHNYRLKITSPTSNRQSIRQSIVSDYYVEVPSSGLLFLKLIPSSKYLPKGYYKVEYFIDGRSVPTEVQLWSIPERLPLGYYTFTWDGSDIIFPADAYSVSSLSPSANFVYTYNKLLWSGSQPDLNQTFTASYVRAATLGDILVRDVP